MRLIKGLRAVWCNSGGERGVVLVTALLVMLILLPLGAAFLAVSLTETTVASNEVSAAKGFNIAEAGLEHAKRTLKMSSASSLNVFLSGTTPGPYPFGGTPGAGNSLGSGNYIVRIYDNDDGDANPLTDSDNIVFIESTGLYGGSQRRIVARVQVPLLPRPDGAVEAQAADEIEVELEKGAVIDGRDWDPPADPSTCVDINSCGSLAAPGNIAGVSTNSVATEIDVRPPSQIFGTPPTKVNSGLSNAPWDRLIDQVIPQADRTMTTPEFLSGTHTWGTPSAPEITVISGTRVEIELGATVNGAGLLIIDNLAELELDHGIFNWQGLIILRGGSKHDIEFETDDDATARIFGGLVVMTDTPNSEVELEVENNKSFVKYSETALDMVRAMLPMTVQTWHEVPM
ncbi:MAG: PilX N-terminal domain-containing pilus assembly protein [Candidatus Methylomirabilales bacterium]